MRAALRHGVTLSGLFAAAAAYFAVGSTLSLEWADEGHIVYPSWRVAQGALPCREFQDIYGPSVFLLNGALFRIFGEDLLVIRASLVVLKAATAVLVYGLARWVAAVPFALVAFALHVVVWGTPWWVFNSPYANHYCMALCLLGLEGFLLARRRYLAACAIAGLCFGAAATFKLTTGLFPAVTFVLFLLFSPPMMQTPPAAQGRLPAALLRGARALGAVGVLGFVAAYLYPRSTAWTYWVLLGPVAATVLVLAWREVTGRMAPADARVVLSGALAAAAATFVPIGFYAAFYASQGLLADLAFCVFDLPRKVVWADPFPLPNRRALIWVATLSAAFAGVWLVRARGGAVRWRRVGAGLHALAGSGIVVACVELARPHGVLAYIRQEAWYGDIFRLYFFLPLVVLWITVGALIWVGSDPGGSRSVVTGWRWRGHGSSSQPKWPRRSGALHADQSTTTESSRGVEMLPLLLLFQTFALGQLLTLYPGADFWHLLMAWPAFLPLLAYWLCRFWTAGDEGRIARFAATALVGVLVVILAAPLVITLAKARAQRDTSARFHRATGISGTQPKFGDAVRLVAYLDERRQPGQSMLVLSNEQMLYFLAALPSALEMREYVLYLAEAGLIDPLDAHAMLPEEAMIERLEERQPIVIDYEGSPMSAHFRERYPSVARYLETRYRLADTVGRYLVFRWAGA